MNRRYLEIMAITASIILLCSYSMREAFTTRIGSSSGEYPSKMLLSDWYPLHKPYPSLSRNGMDKQYVNYPIFPAHSTNINNLRQWRKPNNGRCSRPELCGDVYDDRKIELPVEAKMPGFNEGIRVNYYNSC